MPTNLKPEYEQFLQLRPSSSTFQLLHDKVYGTSPVRARFAGLLYEYLQAYTPHKNEAVHSFLEQQLPFILEVIISVQYYHNQILDGKGGVTTPATINQNLIQGNLLKEKLYRYLEQGELSYSERSELTDCVRKIFEYVDIGQYIEKQSNTYKALQDGPFSHPFEDVVRDFVDEACIKEVLHIIEGIYPIPEKYHPFLRCYLQRIYLTNAALFKLTAILILDLLKIEGETAQRIVRFATLFGLMQQIVNDNCDFIPAAFGERTVEKICGDSFSDVRNRTVTLPVLLHLAICPFGEMARFLDSDKQKINEIVVFKELVKYWSIYYSMTCGKQIKWQALGYLNIENNNYGLLKDFCGFIDNNRYYKYYYDVKIDYQVYRKRK